MRVSEELFHLALLAILRAFFAEIEHVVLRGRNVLEPFVLAQNAVSTPLEVTSDASNETALFFDHPFALCVLTHWKQVLPIHLPF